MECLRRAVVTVSALLLLAAGEATAAFERQLWGAVAIGLGGASSLAVEDPWTALDHPALAALHPGLRISATVHPGAFGLAELRRAGIIGVFPVGRGGMAGGATVYGFELYRELTLAVAGALKVGASLELGATLHLHHLAISGYGSAAAVSLDAGARVEWTPALASTATVSGVLSTALSRDGEQLPREIRLGVAARITETVHTGIEWVGDHRYPLGFAAGVEVRPLVALALRCGASTEPPEYALGVGVHLERFSIDYGCSLHMLLGISHALSITADLSSTE